MTIAQKQGMVKRTLDVREALVKRLLPIIENGPTTIPDFCTVVHGQSTHFAGRVWEIRTFFRYDPSLIFHEGEDDEQATRRISD